MSKEPACASPPQPPPQAATGSIQRALPSAPASETVGGCELVPYLPPDGPQRDGSHFKGAGGCRSVGHPHRGWGSTPQTGVPRDVVREVTAGCGPQRCGPACAFVGAPPSFEAAGADSGVIAPRIQQLKKVAPPFLLGPAATASSGARRPETGGVAASAERARIALATTQAGPLAYDASFPVVRGRKSPGRSPDDDAALLAMAFAKVSFVSVPLISRVEELIAHVTTMCK